VRYAHCTDLQHGDDVSYRRHTSCSLFCIDASSSIDLLLVDTFQIHHSVHRRLGRAVYTVTLRNNVPLISAATHVIRKISFYFMHAFAENLLPVDGFAQNFWRTNQLWESINGLQFCDGSNFALLHPVKLSLCSPIIECCYLSGRRSDLRKMSTDRRTDRRRTLHDCINSWNELMANRLRPRVRMYAALVYTHNRRDNNFYYCVRKPTLILSPQRGEKAGERTRAYCGITEACITKSTSIFISLCAPVWM